MSWIDCPTWAALAAAFLLGLAPQAAAQEAAARRSPPADRLGLLSRGRSEAKNALQQPPGEAVPADASARNGSCCWRRSTTARGNTTRPSHSLRKARQSLDRQRRLHPEDTFTGPRLEMALWQARIELAQAAAAARRRPASPPTSPRKGFRLPSKPIGWNCSCCGPNLPTCAKNVPRRRIGQRRWSPLRQQAEALFKETQAGAESAGIRASVLLSLARCCEAEGTPSRQWSILRAVALPPPGTVVNPRVKELRAETARILRRAKRFPRGSPLLARRVGRSRTVGRSSPTKAARSSG